MISIKTLFQRKFLRRYSSKTQTSITPISKIKSVIAVINLEEESYEAAKDAISEFFSAYRIRVKFVLFAVNTKSPTELSNYMSLSSSIQTEFFLNDIDWAGRPLLQKIEGIDPTDLYISLIPNSDFLIEALSKCVNAKFKIGRKQLPGNTFDFIADNTLTSQLECFDLISSYLSKIV